MKKQQKLTIALTLALFLAGIVCGAGSAIGALTPITPPYPGELGLTDAGGILDQLYGWGNLVRIDDNIDQIWFPANGSATAQAKYADFGHRFGYIPQSGTFQELFTISGPLKDLMLGGPSGVLNSGNVNFIWAIDSGFNVFTSMPGENIDLADHMVTWEIIDTQPTALAANQYRRFVIAWEDLPIDHPDYDGDFQDLVVEVTVAPVPIPGSLLLLGSGVLSLVAIRRKRIG